MVENFRRWNKYKSPQSGIAELCESIVFNEAGHSCNRLETTLKLRHILIKSSG